MRISIWSNWNRVQFHLKLFQVHNWNSVYSTEIPVVKANWVLSQWQQLSKIIKVTLPLIIFSGAFCACVSVVRFPFVEKYKRNRPGDTHDLNVSFHFEMRFHRVPHKTRITVCSIRNLFLKRHYTFRPYIKSRAARLMSYCVRFGHS